MNIYIILQSKILNFENLGIVV